MTKKKNKAIQKVEKAIKDKEQEKDAEQLAVEKEEFDAEQRIKRAKIKEGRKMQKQDLKEQKKIDKDRRKEERQKNRKESKKNSTHKGYIAAIISLGVASLILAGVLTYLLITPTKESKILEASYERYFYDTVSGVDNMDLNLSKSIVTSDSGAMQEYLMDLAVNSETTELNFQELPLKDENKYYTTKLINQIGDYAKYLSKKIAQGGEPSAEDRETLVKLYNSNLDLKKHLQDMMNEMGEDFDFSNLDNANVLTEGLNELQNLSVEYPELIYDGPFSDGREDREIKGISGEEILEAEAKSIFTQIFGEYGLENVEVVGRTNSLIECYNIEGDFKGLPLYAQMSKIGGKLIMFNYAGSCNSTEYTMDFAEQKAKEFLESIGLTDMMAVWGNLSNNVYTINFAFGYEDIPVYSDLIKVRVCAETCTIIGLEGVSYYTNHCDRVLPTPVLGMEEASTKVSDNIEIIYGRLALIPIGTSQEKLCYEFNGVYNDSTYYVYIDAITGKQVQMFKVIEGTEGLMLM